MEFMNKISAWSDSLVKLNTATQMGFLTSLLIPRPFYLHDNLPSIFLHTRNSSPQLL